MLALNMGIISEDDRYRVLIFYNVLFIKLKTSISQESLPVWKQETYRLPRSKYMLYCSGWGMLPSWPVTWPGQGEGVPQGTPSSWPWMGVPPVLTWNGCNPHPDLEWGYPSVLTCDGVPPHSDLEWVTPILTWDGILPCWSRTGVAPVREDGGTPIGKDGVSPSWRMGYPCQLDGVTPSKCGQTFPDINITLSCTSYAGGNKGCQILWRTASQVPLVNQQMYSGGSPGFPRGGDNSWGAWQHNSWGAWQHRYYLANFSL